MAQPGFIFGKGTPDTYESLQAKRLTAQRLQVAASRAPQNVGEGLTSLGQAIAYRRLMNQADTGDAAGRAAYDEKRGSVLGSLMSGSLGGSAPAFNPAVAAPVTANPAGLDPAIIAAVDRVNPQGPEAEIRAGLIERGMPPHIADGFVMNFKDESGLNPGINEAAPIVPGSRGGFGLAQWTGPRRVALEKFAAERGAAPSDTNVQLDFLMTELQGPEAGAARSILAAPDAGSAAAAIATDFLRPAPEHLSRRVADYTGGQGMNPGASIPAIMEIMADPYAPEGDKAVLGMLLQQQLAQMQPPDPMEALDMEYKRAQIDQMKNPEANVPEGWLSKHTTALSGGLVPGTPEYEQFMLGSDSTEYGLTAVWGRDENGNPVPAQLSKNGTIKTVDLPQGWTPDPGLTAQMQAEGKVIGDSTGTAKVNLDGALAKVKQTIDLVDTIAADPSLPSITGSVQGGLLPAGVPLLTGGQAGKDLSVKISQLQGKVFLQAYESLRGAAAITDIEGKAATDALARLNTAQGTEAYKSALMDFKREVIALADLARKKAGVAPTAASPLEMSDDDFLKSLGLE